MFAAGGDVRRDPTLADPAVVELAADLDSRERRAALLEASPELRALDDPDVAWRAYACGLLAEALGEEEDDMSETRFNGELEEPGDKDLPDEGEPWAKTSSGDADDITSDDDDND